MSNATSTKNAAASTAIGLVSIEPDADTPAPTPTPTATSSPSSQLLYFPGPNTPPPRMAGAGPERLVADPVALASSLPYNLLEDIKLAQQTQSGPKEKISLYNFPSYIGVNIRRVLARSKNGKGDWGLALSCLLWQGIARYSALPATRDLTAALRDLDTDDGLDAVAGEQVELWRRGFRFSVQDPTHSLGLEKCRTFKTPEHVHTELFDLAGRLGLSGSTLGVVAVMATLADQVGVLVDHARYMEKTVEDLDQLIEDRASRLQRLVRAIEAGVWKP